MSLFPSGQLILAISVIVNDSALMNSLKMRLAHLGDLAVVIAIKENAI